MLEEGYGADTANRYHVWNQWQQIDKPLFILIGGASGVGKTSLAINLATTFGIPRVVATDDIRQIMRLMLSPQLMPTLHTSSYNVHTGGDTDADDPIAGYRLQAKSVNVGVKAILDRCRQENTSVIIDGVHLLPDFLDTEHYADTALVIQMALSVDDHRTFKDRFTQRNIDAPQRPKDRYLSHIGDILKIQQHILQSCSQRSIPVLVNTSLEKATAQATEQVIAHIERHPDLKPLLVDETPKGAKKKVASEKKRTRAKAKKRAVRPKKS